MEKFGNVLNWATILDEETREQATMTAGMPFIQPHLALMPDAHLGKGCSVGTVLPTVRAIIPAAVGVDIGCGMIAVRAQFIRAALPPNLRELRERIERVIPLSVGQHNTSLTATASARTDSLEALAAKAGFDPAKYAGNWKMQLGTLGSGNHFIEVSEDEAGRVWLFLHSGSRGVGNKIALHHIGVAQELAARWWIDLPHKDLAYLVEGTDEFWAYIRELRWAQEFALANREEMMDRVIEQFEAWVGSPVVRQQKINCHHNYTAQERHYGQEVWISRKGAISAKSDEWGLIPGSMGDASHVVQGLGNRESFSSAPHGAGRQHSRSAARKAFTVEQLREAMVGIEYRDTDAFVDEIPGAYKPIDQVMEDAQKLVVIRHTLRQFVNVKGD